MGSRNNWPEAISSGMTVMMGGRRNGDTSNAGIGNC